MSKNNKQSAKEVIQTYYDRYLQYEKAFNEENYSREDMQKKVMEIAMSDIDPDSDEFFEKMSEVLLDQNMKTADVNNAAFRFVLAVDFYLLTEDEDLPENLMKDYDSIPIKNAIKPFYSIEGGKFVKNQDTELTLEQKQYFKDVANQIRQAQATN